MSRKRFRIPFWARPLLALPLVIAVAAWTYFELERAGKARLADSLQTLLRADVEAVTVWFKDQEKLAELLVAAPRVRNLISEIQEIARQGSPDALKEAPQHQTLAALLQTPMAAQDWLHYAVISSEGQVLSASLVADVGTRIDPFPPPVRERLAVGKSVILPPFRIESMERQIALAVVSPIRAEDGQVLAVLAFLSDPGEFTRILNVARFGETGETYAFDRNGVMLSDSRFNERLQELGLLGDSPDARPVGIFELRNPGGNLLKGHDPGTARRSLPLTRMVAEAIEGRSGVDTEGYLDYLGVEAVGAWTWLEGYDMGIGIEVDAEEAFALLGIIRRAFRVVVVGLLIASFGLLIASGNLYGLQKKARRLGQYTLLDKLGEGGMGAVYRARHALLRRPTAVKLIREEQASGSLITRFEREVQLTSQLTHPNTVAIYDFGRTPEGVFYYAMELLDGVSLDHVVGYDGPQPEARVVHILRQMCGSLAEAHSTGLVHRDIKPGNIMLCKRGGVFDVVKVLDFGLVKELGDQDASLTASGAVVGTPQFLSPESVRTPDSVDARSDVYAVGAVAYELITGKRLFEGDTSVEIVGQHLHTPPVPPSDRLGREVDGFLEELVLTCLAKGPELRPADAGALLERLEQGWRGAVWTQPEARAWWDARADALRPAAESPSRGPDLDIDIEDRVRSGPDDVTRTGGAVRRESD